VIALHHDYFSILPNMKTKGLSLYGFVCTAELAAAAPYSHTIKPCVCAFLLFTAFAVVPVEAALTNITSRGFVDATSCFTLPGTTRCDPRYSPDRAIDGTTNTSWGSDGTRTGGEIEVFYWQYGPFENILIARIEIDPSSISGYGFRNMSERVLDRDGNVVRQYNWIFSDWLIRLHGNLLPNTFGRTIELVFTTHQNPDRGGFGELRVFTDSLPESFTVRNDPPFCPPHSLEGPSIDLQWTLSNGAGRYDVFRDGRVRFSTLRTNSVRDTLLETGSNYTYRIVAWNASLTASNVSNEITVQVPLDICTPGVIFVDCSYAGIDANGSRQRPYRTVTNAYQTSISGDTLRIFACNYCDTLTLSKPLRLEATNGIVNIGCR